MSTFDFRTLESNFKQEAIKQSFENIYQCIGFITAIASSPDQVKPSEWINQIITVDEKNLTFDDKPLAKSVSNDLIAWWSRCITIFDHEATIELPTKLGLTPTGKPNKALSEFSSGYLKGYEWLSKTWQTMLPKDNEEAARGLSVLNAILGRFINEKAVKEAHPELLEQLPDMTGCLQALPNLVSAVGMLGKDLSNQDKVPVTNEKIIASPAQNLTKNIGRNASCPCGSGKKFKKCCLH